MNNKDAKKAIIEKFKSKDIELNEKEVEDKLFNLTENFCIPVKEAKDAVMKSYAKEHKIKLYDERSSTVSKVREVDIAGTWVNVDVVCLKAIKPHSDKIYATGVLADESGEIPFTAWARKNSGTADMFPKFFEGHSYRISNAVINEYNGVMTLYMNSVTSAFDLGKSDGKIKTEVIDISNIVTGLNTIEGKVVKVFDSDAEKIASTGIIGDETGTIKYTIWQSNAPKINIEEGKCYRMERTLTSLYNDKLSIIANDSVKEIKRDIEVKSNEREIIGIVANVKEKNSGIVHRCKVADCKRLLDRRMMCDAHGKQIDYDSELRVSCIVDDGKDTFYATIKQDAIEKIVGFNFDYAQEFLKNNPIGNEELYAKIVDEIIGKYYKFKCIDFGTNLVVIDAETMPYDEFVEYIGKIDVSEQKTLEECD